MKSDRAKTSRETGYAAESAVAAKLEADGSRILERNYHSRFGELDIISENGGVIVFVEVKFRKNTSYGSPAEAVTVSKRRKIIKTAEIYMADKGLCDSHVRFDVAEVYGNGKINIIEGAFDLNDAYRREGYE